MHFVFRMEKLAGTLQQARLLSEPAWARLAALIEAHELGRHGVAGFEGDYLFYGF
jgi:hypothetical protein